MNENFDLYQISKAVIAKSGGPAKLGAYLNISTAGISQWEKIPSKHLGKIEKLLDGAIEAAEMRPDIHPQPLSPKHLLEKMERVLTQLEEHPELGKHESDRLNKVADRVGKMRKEGFK